MQKFIYFFILAALCASCRTSKTAAEQGAAETDSTAVAQSLRIVSANALSSQDIELRFDSLTISTALPLGDSVENLRLRAVGVRIAAHKEQSAESASADLRIDSIHTESASTYERHTEQQSKPSAQSSLPLIIAILIAFFFIAVSIRRK